MAYLLRFLLIATIQQPHKFAGCQVLSQLIMINLKESHE
uniref:Uncharacterized protein n=1 Tax=Rhizophora mucronata TaxID=61149 RepID=A0A2P2PXP5_RHIMU